jgi:hypothetical protein
MGDQVGQSFALLPRRSNPWISVSKPGKSSVKKFIRGRSLSTAALPVERPAKNPLSRTVMLGSDLPEPVIDERRFPDTSLVGNYRNDIYIGARPRIIQESDILLSTKNIAPSYGQSCY